MQIILRCFFSLFLLASLLSPLTAAHAAGPNCDAAAEGTILYNKEHKLVQFCNGTQWIGMTAKIGGAGDTLSDLSCTSGQIVQWNGSNWTCADDGGGADNLGNHTATQNLDMDGNAIISTASLELTAVTGNAPLGSPGGVDTLSGLSCSSGQIIKFNGTAWVCADDDAGMSALPDLSFASIWVGNASDEAVAVSMSGDAILTSAGVLTIADNAITSAKIADGAVALAKLAANAVDSSKIVDGSVALADLADNSVNSAKIVDGSVAAANLASDAVTEVKIANSAVTANKIANASIVATTKLSATGTKNATTFLRGDNTWASPPAGGGGSASYQSFTSSGTWTKPASGAVAFIECWGGGGGGGKWASGSVGGAGGGGGAAVVKWLQTSTLPASVTVTIGSGGAGASSTNNGANGGTTSFGSYLTALGGGGGSGYSTAGIGGAPAGGTFNTLTVYHGGNGAESDGAGFSSYYGGGGGGSRNGAGGQSVAGGNGGAGTTGSGAPGQQPGGGGGGGKSGSGGKGGDGQCNVTVF